MGAFLLADGQIFYAAGVNGNALRESVAPRAPITTLKHPEYIKCIDDWDKWRVVYEGGEEFIQEYTKKFSRRETSKDFRLRKSITPTPVFAKAAIDEIKNAIFERTSDITRIGGPDNYHVACAGQLGGIDLSGATMNRFIGHNVLPEMLVMKKVGVWVDNPNIGVTQADKGNKHPYLYYYKAEDICTWGAPKLTEVMVRGKTMYRREFPALLLKDWIYELDDVTKLPMRCVEAYRHVFIGEDGFVKIQMYSDTGVKGPFYELGIKRIPFVCFELTDSLLKHVANHQIALLNLESSDVSYAVRGNFAIYTEQRETNNAPAIKAAQEAFKRLNTSGTSPQSPLPECSTELIGDNELDLGVTEGRSYPKGMERPGFINPSAEPLTASMGKQTSLKEDIRALVHLALSAVQSKMASAESKGLDRKGLESGLSAIGLELEQGERQIASFWAMYEGTDDEPQVLYPEDYSLQNIDDIIKRTEALQAVRDDLPSPTAKKQLNKEIARQWFAAKVKPEILTTIYSELDRSQVPSSDPKVITVDVAAALVSMETASVGRGYATGESQKAQDERAQRQAAIAQAQGLLNSDPNARGVSDLGTLPQDQTRGPNKL